MGNWSAEDSVRNAKHQADMAERKSKALAQDTRRAQAAVAAGRGKRRI